MAERTTLDDRTSDPEAVFFVSHSLQDYVLRRFRKLEREALPADDVYFALDTTNVTDAQVRRARSTVGDRLRTYRSSQVIDVDYPGLQSHSVPLDSLRMHVDLLYLYLSRTEREYSRYWFVEYDVAYTGSWAEVFGAFDDSDADVLGTSIRSCETDPDWRFWHTLEPVPDLDESELLTGFFPVIRLSGAALERLDRGYRAGWSGIFEAVVPTLANYHGLEVEDLGGDGPYVRDENRNRFYENTPQRGFMAPGTFVYRPVRPRPGRSPGKLWHPVKPTQSYTRFYPRYLKERLYHGLSGDDVGEVESARDVLTALTSRLRS